MAEAGQKALPERHGHRPAHDMMGEGGVGQHHQAHYCSRAANPGRHDVIILRGMNFEGILSAGALGRHWQGFATAAPSEPAQQQDDGGAGGRDHP